MIAIQYLLLGIGFRALWYNIVKAWGNMSFQRFLSMLSCVFLPCASSYQKTPGVVVHHGLGKETMKKQRKKRCRYITERLNNVNVPKRNSLTKYNETVGKVFHRLPLVYTRITPKSKFNWANCQFRREKMPDGTHEKYRDRLGSVGLRARATGRQASDTRYGV